MSHVINGTRSVSDKSRKLVEDAISEIGYKPNRAARVLKTQRSDTVALVIPSVKPGRSTNFFFMNVISGAKDALSAQGYDLIVSTYAEESSGDEQAELAVLQKQWIDGLLLVPGERTSRAASLVEESKIPFVLVDRTVENESYPSVYSDNFTATKKAIELFHSCGKRRIAYLGGMVGYSTGYSRFKGYRDALEQLGLEYDDSIVLQDVQYHIPEAAEAASILVERGVDAIFTANNILTMGVIKHLSRQGLSIPADVGVIGYEDYEWMEIFSPPITTIQQQSYAMGTIAAEMLLEKMSTGHIERPHQVLEAPLVVRGSHG